jgi:adenylate cyclase class 2
MPWEVEQKFRVNGFSRIEQGLVACGMALGDTAQQTDHYFNHPARDFARTDEALRLRQDGERNFVTYKGPKIDATTKTRRELELPLPAGDQLISQYRALWEALGFRYVATVHKRRRTAAVHWEQRDFEVVLDEVERLGWFVELETQAGEEELDAARAALASLAARLGLTNIERRSYLELLLAEGK